MVNNSLRVLAIASVLGAFASAAFAQNLVQNPGFEANSTGTPNNWTLEAASTGSDWFLNTSATNSHSGSNSLAFGAVSQIDDRFYQDVATGAGTTYTYSLWCLGNSSPQSLTIMWEGNVLFQGAATAGWNQYSFNVTATGATSRVEFGGWNTPSFNYVDDVSLVSTVPEPASMAALGIGALALLRRRRK